MKRTMLLFVMFFYLFSFQSTIYAAGTTTAGDSSVYDTIHKGDGKTPSPSPKAVDSQSPSIFPLFIKFIVSFIIVIGLLIMLLRFLQKRGNLVQSNGPIVSIGGHSLGNNRSLQVLLIGQTLYIIGVGETVTLLRTISQGEEYQSLFESYESQAETQTPLMFTKDPKILWDTVFRKQMQKKKFFDNGEE
jgi:flagellar protein FliO/FliZ